MGLAACTAILGSFEVDPSAEGQDASTSPDVTSDGALATDAGANDALPDAPVSTDANPVDASSDAPVLSEPCTFDSDGGAVVVYPGDPCLFKDGAPIPSVGTCKPGRWACIDVGGGQRFAQCNGAVGPQVKEVCSPSGATIFEDENCNGTADEGCACALGAERPCGVGQCALGAKQTCVALDGGAGWGPCVGPAPRPRDCTSTLDNDCNGTPDSAESFCKCLGPGTVNPPLYDVGKELKCSEFGSSNACASVLRKCVVAAEKTGVKWDVDCRSGVLTCGSNLDNDCNNVADSTELRCGCRNTVGKTVAAHQVLVSAGPTSGIVGCGGAVTQASAALLCRPGCSPTTLQYWQSSAVPNNVTPTANYWLAEGNLRYANNTLVDTCTVAPSGTLPITWKECTAREKEARVCTASTAADAFGNRCEPRCPTAKALGGCGGVTTDTASTACTCP